jgi:uncharacterized protein YdaL
MRPPVKYDRFHVAANSNLTNTTHSIIKTISAIYAKIYLSYKTGTKIAVNKSASCKKQLSSMPSATGQVATLIGKEACNLAFIRSKNCNATNSL